MKHAFLQALEDALRERLVEIPPKGLLCVPQQRSLVAEPPLSSKDIKMHFLVPPEDEDTAQPGEYVTLDGRYVSILGSHVHTKWGFSDQRQVRILLTEDRQIHHQQPQIKILHVSRPLSGGLELPEDPNEMDVATFRRYTALLRSFPEYELLFTDLDETIHEIHDLCSNPEAYLEHAASLPNVLEEVWEESVQQLLENSALAGISDQDTRTDMMLPMQQVVECYLMENIYDTLFLRVQDTCRQQDTDLAHLLHGMRHCTPQDFGIRPEFQIDGRDARDALLCVFDRKTPLDMLLALKNCIDLIHASVTKRLRQRRLSLDWLELSTDDILDELLYVLVQAFVKACALSYQESGMKETPWPHTFPLASTLEYVTKFHFINSNSTTLGYTLATFQVALEYFLLRAHPPSRSSDDDLVLVPSSSFIIPRCETEYAYGQIVQSLQPTSQAIDIDIQPHKELDDLEEPPCPFSQQLLILGDWFISETSTEGGNSEDSDGTDQSYTTLVERGGFLSVDAAAFQDQTIHSVGVGNRFFAVVTTDGHLYTWGDRSLHRSGPGWMRRVEEPQRVSSLANLQIKEVACGSYHALATDVNGHVLAWGSNSHFQLGLDVAAKASLPIARPTIVQAVKGTFMTQVACGEYHSLVLSSDGELFSWGSNEYGQLGRASNKKEVGSVATCWLVERWDDVQYRDGVACIRAGPSQSMAVTFSGAVFTWGRGDSGQLGHGCWMDVGEPKQVMALAPSDQIRVLQVAAGASFMLFLVATKRKGEAWVFVCGKDPAESIVEDEDDELPLFPKHVEIGETVSSVPTAVSSGENHYAILYRNGEVVLSSGETTASMDRQQRVTKMECGGSHTLLLLS